MMINVLVTLPEPIAIINLKNYFQHIILYIEN